jgi:hypothetical protein
MVAKEDVTYDIVYLNKDIGRISVAYKTPIFTRGMIYNLDLPVENNSVPSGQALHDFIISNAPLEQLTYQEENAIWEKERSALTAQVDYSHIIVTNLPRNVNDNQPVTNGTTVI